MKTKIGEKMNKVKINSLKGLLKAYPGAALLAALVVVGSVSAGAMALSGNTDEPVLDNDSAVVDEVEGNKEKEDNKEDDKTPAVNKEETKDAEDEKKDDESAEGEAKEGEESKEGETTGDNNASASNSDSNNSTSGTANTSETGEAAAVSEEGKTETVSTGGSTAATTEEIKASSMSLAAKAKTHKETVNSDTIGWINVPNTNINYPVVQYSDNSYYAAKDYNKNYSKNGVIYADYECNFSKGLATNNILYGHNWTNCWNPIRINNANDVMFAQLAAFHYLDVAQKTPFIYFSTTSKDYVWQVFAAFYTEATWTDYIYAYPSNFANVIKEAKARSLHNYNVSVTTSDKILTLSTCTRIYGNHNNQRFVVMAKLVPAGTASTTITANPNFKRPNC